MATYTFVTGDTGVVLRRTLKDENGVVIDVTGAQHVKVRWKQKGVVTEKTMTVEDAVNGLVKYQFAANDLQAGDVSFEFEVKDSLGQIITSPDLDGPYKVRKELG